MKKLWWFFAFLLAALIFPKQQFAHEAYVLTHNEFQQGLSMFTTNPLTPLFDAQYRGISLIIALSVAVTFILTFLFATTKLAALLDKTIKKANLVGPLIIRMAISSSFFYAAFANAILGPELPLQEILGGTIIRFLLFVLSVMIFFGFLTELAALVGLGLFIYVTFTFKLYMIAYVNYFGELIVLLLFGSRFLSLDRFFFGKKTLLPFLEKWRYLEIPIVRVLYGIALIYAGVTIKFLHQSLSVAVYNQYHLINFFHASPQFIAAGAGVSEVLIGLFILIGFGQRITIFISLIFITLSILYFREMLWPHFMLYGISFSLFINSGDKFTIDRYLIPFLRNMLKKVSKK